MLFRGRNLLPLPLLQQLPKYVEFVQTHGLFALQKTQMLQQHHSKI